VVAVDQSGPVASTFPKIAQDGKDGRAPTTTAARLRTVTVEAPITVNAKVMPGRPSLGRGRPPGGSVARCPGSSAACRRRTPSPAPELLSTLQAPES